MRDDLVFVFVLSDGQVVNGTELSRAMSEKSKGRIVVGGLAGDGANFGSTLVGLNQSPDEGNVVAVGFYGNQLKVGHAAKGGWDPFGPERFVTKSNGNVLYELDDKPALELYKKYLGEFAEDLPGAALVFPLGIKIDESYALVRTVLEVNHEDNSMQFAGDIPEGATVRMMKSNFDRLVDAAGQAAITSTADFGSFDPGMALLVSCAGRRFVLQDRTYEEVSRVKDELGSRTKIAGFYGYGEISALVDHTGCELHNQTMTITTIEEVEENVGLE